MQPSIPYPVLNELTGPQIEQLHALYLGEWWSTGRSLAEVRIMLQHSDFIFAIVVPDTQRLLAFARVLSDRIFKAMTFDVIVHPDHRSAGLGSFLIEHITTHPILSTVRHIELYCAPERANFYERHGFIPIPGNLLWLRRTNGPSPG